MAAPVALNQNDLLIRPGNDFTSPTWAILSTTGQTFSLTGWEIWAQARLSIQDPAVFQEFTRDRGLVVGQTSVISPVTGQEVVTSTVQLVLGRDETARWPQYWTGIYDVQIRSAGPPAEQHTIVPTARLFVVGGPTYQGS